MARTNTKERILDVTAEMFRRYGYTGTGLKQVVAAYSGGDGKTGQIERLITARENLPFNGTGSMRAAFTSASAGWRDAPAKWR